MDAESYREQFNRNGFIHVKGVLATQEVTATRARLHDLFDEAEARNPDAVTGGIMPFCALNEPLINSVPLKASIVDALKAILEPEYTMFPDLTAVKNQFGISGGGKYAGWHWDSSSEGKRVYFLDPQYRFVKCGLYMQENNVDYGGGVDVVPGHHRWPLKTRNVDMSFKFKNLYDQIGIRLAPLTVPLQAGDFLAFQSCMPHRSTLPRKLLSQVTDEDRKQNRISSVPRDKTKFTIYWNSCRSAFAPPFVENSVRRAEEEELADADRSSFFFTEYASLKFPSDFPSDFVSGIRAAGLRIATVEPERADSLRRAFEMHPGFVAKMQ